VGCALAEEAGELDGDVEDGGAEEAEEGEEEAFAAGLEEGVGGGGEFLVRRPVLVVERIRGPVVGMVKGRGVHIGYRMIETPGWGRPLP
jgi:hypothetical protein